MTCKHLWNRVCALGLCNGVPAKSCCARCEKYEGSPRGAGDVVHAVTKFTGIASVVKAVTKGKCGCAERRAKMNESMPFKKGDDEVQR